MPYYDTIEEDLARAREILAKGKVRVEDVGGADQILTRDPALRDALIERMGGTIFGADVFAAYKLLESFVATIERLTHALNTCEIHQDVENIAERTACAVCFTETGEELQRVKADQARQREAAREDALRAGEVINMLKGQNERLRAFAADAEERAAVGSPSDDDDYVAPHAFQPDHNAECLVCDNWADHPSHLLVNRTVCADPRHGRLCWLPCSACAAECDPQHLRPSTDDEERQIQAWVLHLLAALERRTGP